MTVTDPYTGIGVITRGVFDSDMAAISLSLHPSCNDIALNEKNSPSFCQIHFYRGIFHLLSSCTLSTLRAFNSSSFHPSSPQIHPFSMIPVTPHEAQADVYCLLFSARLSGFSAKALLLHAGFRQGNVFRRSFLRRSSRRRNGIRNRNQRGIHPGYIQLTGSGGFRADGAHV